MRVAIATYLPWLLSAITIYMTILAGNKTRWAWAIGIANQALWLTWIIASETWGMLPMTAALTFVYARNHLKWSRAPQLKTDGSFTEGQRVVLRNASMEMEKLVPNPNLKIGGGP